MNGLHSYAEKFCRAVLRPFATIVSGGARGREADSMLRFLGPTLSSVLSPCCLINFYPRRNKLTF